MSGHSSSLPCNMTHVLVNVFELLLQVSGFIGSSCSIVDCAEPSTRATTPLNNFSAPPFIMNGIDIHNPFCHQTLIGGLVTPTSHPSIDVHLKEDATAYFFSGHISSVPCNMPHVAVHLFQVGKRRSHEFHCDDPFLVVLLRPASIHELFSDVLRSLALLSGGVFLLLLGKDIELNPGPMSKAQEEQLALVLSIVQKLQSGQNDIMSQVKTLDEEQSRTEENISTLRNVCLP